MRFSEAFIDAQSLLGGVSGQGEHFLRLSAVVTSKRRVGVGESDIRQSVIAVFFNGLRKKLDAFLHPFSGALVPEVTALHIELIGFAILRVAFGQLAFLVATQMQSQRLSDLARN